MQARSLSSSPSEPDIWPDHLIKSIRCGAEGFVLGADTPLVRRTDAGRFGVGEDGGRCLALLSVLCRRPVDADMLRPIEAAAIHWALGDKALANLRLVFSGLPKLEVPADAARLQAAAYCLDNGMTPHDLMTALDLDPFVLDLVKFDPDQPRVPAGNGQESGRWRTLWDDVVGWLKHPVPEYDTDTGIQVGTQSRGRAIATSPATVGIAGTAALLGGEAAAVAALPAPVTIIDVIAALPEGMSMPEFGQLAGFSQGLEESSQASIEATPELITRLQSAGITRKAISLTQRFYAGVAKDNPKNLSGAQRAALLNNILRGYPK